MARRARAADTSTGLATGTAWLVTGLIGCVLASCASPPPVPACHSGSIDRPAITEECRAQPAAHQWVTEAGARFGEELLGWRSYQGELDVSVAFDGHGDVEFVCRRRVTGKVVSSRAPRAVAALSEQRRPPACFVGHRIEFRWESPVVTDADIQLAMESCSQAARVPVRYLDFCQHSERCSHEEWVRLLGKASDLFSGCVLRQLPLTLVAQDDELVTFLPRVDATPTGALALSALKACDTKPASRQAAVACMTPWGWERVDSWDRPGATLDRASQKQNPERW